MNRFAKATFAFILLAVFYFPGKVRAEELPLFFEGIRPLGMGGAFTAVADDENAIFYNPAGMNNIEGFGGVEILNPFVEVSRKTIDFFKDLQDVSDAPTDTEQAALASDLLQKWLGERLHLRAGAFPNVTFHNFGVGVLGQGVFDGEVHNPLGADTLDLRGGYDLALLVSGAYGFSAMNSSFKIGLTGKMVNRSKLEQAYTTRELVEQDGIDLDRDLKKGSGFSVDLGAIYSAPVFLNPSLGLTVQNAVGGDLGDAGELQRQYNLGFALKPAIGFGTVTLALDIMDLTRSAGEDDDLAKRLHAGVEYNFPMILGVRTGLYQGYPSYGATLDFRLMKVSYASYAAEIGAFAGQRSDRRHVAQVSLGF